MQPRARFADHTLKTLATSEWLEFDKRHPAPTFFARPAWSLALASSFTGYEVAPLCFANGGRVFLVPTVRVNTRMRWRKYDAFPQGTYTYVQPLDGGSVSAEETAEVLQAAISQTDSFSAVPWPIAGPIPLKAPSINCETAVIDLRPGVEAVTARMNGKSRRMAGQAKRRGVQCAVDESENAVDTYYNLLEESARRWGIGKPTISKLLLENVRRFGMNDVEIWFAYHAGQPIAGGVVLYGADELFFWSAAMLAESGTLRPSNALNVALIQTAIDRGMSWYNLGASDGLPGVRKFKQYLGAADVAYRSFKTARATYTTMEWIRTRAKNAWPIRTQTP